MEEEKREYKIAHISDFHCGSQYFVAHLMEQVIKELNEFKPDIVVATGDLTENGFKQDYRTAKGFLDMIECENIIVVPGNHDSRNVGYIHFEDFFGYLDTFYSNGTLSIVSVDSSEPDLDEGRVGREKYEWISNCFKRSTGIKIVALHHHLIPIPNTGRERNIIVDAGDFLKLLVENGVSIVLSGHRHVPNIWNFENMFIINAGTACTVRVRGYTEPSYNLITFDGNILKVYRKAPFGKKDLVLKTEKFQDIICEVPPIRKDD